MNKKRLYNARGDFTKEGLRMADSLGLQIASFFERNSGVNVRDLEILLIHCIMHQAALVSLQSWGKKTGRKEVAPIRKL